MALKTDSQIRSEAPAGALSGNDIVVVTQSNVTKGSLLSDIANFIGGWLGYVTNITALRALTGASRKVAHVWASPGRNGTFRWDAGNLSALVALDTFQGIYVPPDSDPSGVSGAWVRVFNGEADLRWFGCVGDGATDNSSALTAAFTLGNLFDFYAPAGTYRCNSTVTANGVRCVVRGALGAKLSQTYATIFKFMNDTDGFSFGATTPVGTVSFKGCSIQTAQPASTRSAIVAVMDTTGGGNVDPSIVFEDVDFRGVDETIHWWKNGIKATNAAVTSFTNVFMVGRVNATSAQMTAIGGAGVHLIGTQIAVFHKFEACHILHQHYGVLCESSSPGSGQTRMEGIRFIGCDMVMNNYSYRVVYTGDHKSFHVETVGCHGQFFLKGVHFTNCGDVFVHDNYLQTSGTENTAVDGIHLEGCYKYRVHDNDIEALPSHTTMRGIHITDGLIGREHDNTIDTPGVGVLLDGTTTQNTEYSNDQVRVGAVEYSDTSSGINVRGVREPAWPQTTPIPTAGSGSLTSASSIVHCLKNGKTAKFNVKVTITTNGTGATSIGVTMPFVAQADCAGGGRSFGGSFLGLMWWIAAGTSTLFITHSGNNSYPGSDGAILVVSGAVPIT